MGTLEYLRTPRAVHERCRAVLELARAGGTPHFSLAESQISEVAARVARVLHEGARPTGRYAHFGVGGVDRLAAFDARLAPEERTTARLELVVTSVLLDAGAGPSWTFEEDGRVYRRSEGLAIASMRAFERGAFSSVGGPRADAAGLEGAREDVFYKYFAVRPDNALVGVAGRVALLRALGRAVRLRRDVFGDSGRLGGLLDALRRASEGEGRVRAPAVLAVLLDAFESVWEGRLAIEGKGLGDTWAYPPLGEGARGLVPFHKLAQWTTYSLVEPLAEAGLTVTDLDLLTALADYRNGGLLLDAGVLVPRDPAALARTWLAKDELVVEWRALTVALLDEVEARVRRESSAPHDKRTFEAATWTAGRVIAAERRADASSPVWVESDGTVF